MIGTLGWQELLIILVILALIFGATRVASLGGALGRGIREFRQEASIPAGDADDEADVAADEDEEPAPATRSGSDSEKAVSGSG